MMVLGGAGGRLFPAATVHPCIVLRLRASLDSDKLNHRKPLANVRTIYTAPSAGLALYAREAVECGAWG